MVEQSGIRAIHYQLQDREQLYSIFVIVFLFISNLSTVLMLGGFKSVIVFSLSKRYCIYKTLFVCEFESPSFESHSDV
jgi:hypothetical protein